MNHTILCTTVACLMTTLSGQRHFNSGSGVVIQSATKDYFCQAYTAALKHALASPYQCSAIPVQGRP